MVNKTVFNLVKTENIVWFYSSEKAAKNITKIQDNSFFKTQKSELV